MDSKILKQSTGNGMYYLTHGKGYNNFKQEVVVFQDWREEIKYNSINTIYDLNYLGNNNFFKQDIVVIFKNLRHNSQEKQQNIT